MIPALLTKSITLSAHIHEANVNIQEFLDTTALMFKEAEVWRSEIDCNIKVRDHKYGLAKAN